MLFVALFVFVYYTVWALFLVRPNNPNIPT
jgi:hypothetical protein